MAQEPGVLLPAAIAYWILQQVLIASHGDSSPPEGRDRLGLEREALAGLLRGRHRGCRLVPLGWTVAPLQGTDRAVEIRSGDRAIGTLRVAEGAISAFSGVVYVQVDDMQDSWRKSKELGATQVPGFPFDPADDGGALGLVLDPSGHPVGLYPRAPLPRPQQGGGSRADDESRTQPPTPVPPASARALLESGRLQAVVSTTDT